MKAKLNSLDMLNGDWRWGPKPCSADYGVHARGIFYLAPVDVAAFKRLSILIRPHHLSRIYGGNESNPQYLYYAQTKIAIANELAHKRNPRVI
jgi:hypothetical protein